MRRSKVVLAFALPVGLLALQLLRFTANHYTHVSNQTTQVVFSPLDATTVLQQYFPQVHKCGSSRWRTQYAQLHENIVTKRLPPRYLTSVAVEAGMADRITGLVTQFYLAMVSHRALTMVTHGDLPAFESACDMPYINWTHPSPLPEAVITPVKAKYKGPRKVPDQFQTNTTLLFLVMDKENPREPDLKFLENTNLTSFPADDSNVAHVLSSSNRGHTYKLMYNPYHRQQLSTFGLTPETAFMCGWFYLCAPNTAVQRLYMPYWDALSEPGVLRIGINIRVGDGVFANQQDNLGESQLSAAAPYFQCAERIEKAHAIPTQKVIWYVMADSLPLRRAAAKKYGYKVLTDITTITKHPDCHQHNPKSCDKLAMDLSIQHSLGQLFTFAMADFHIFTKMSGFGRLGAWMSGKYDNLYELKVDPAFNLDVMCNPKAPTKREDSAQTWAQV